MSQPRISMLGSQEAALTAYLDSHPLGHERAAIVLFRRIHTEVPDLEQSDRFVAVHVIPFENSWVTSSSGAHISFELKYFREVFRRCEEESLVFGFVHNHPGGPLDFSHIDDENEKTLITAIRNRNGKDIHLIAMLWSRGIWKARVRHGVVPEKSYPARHILIVARPLRVHLDRRGLRDDELYARQAAAFGQPFVDELRSLRVAVVGAGGTGSPTVGLLARAGVGEIVVIDGDALERSNLNRVRGATAGDVGQNKAGIQKRFVEGLRLPVRIAAVNSYVDVSPHAVDALASCDVLFGCTDDQIGREILNTCVYVYAQPYIDVGLGGQIGGDRLRPYLRYHFGRVSTILPESGECLFCQGVIKDVWIRHQYAVRQDPALTEQTARERYLEHSGEQAPGVGPFTSAVADYGVATLFDLVHPFRKFRPEIRPDFFTIDFVRMELRSSEERNDPDCIYCQQRLYLLKSETYRLNRPALGKRNAAV
jgi:molybdopterin-synthase adenylyltransferase